MTILIFANGIIEDVDWIRPYLSQAAAIIAANGGSQHLIRLDVRPDVVVGDMDSIEEAVLEGWSAAGTAVISHPAEKDETDLELALLYAVEHYTGEINLFGTLGGRLDQTLANIMLLAHPALEGRRVELVEPTQRAWLARERVEITGRPGDRISLIPLGGDARIGRTSGLKWRLEDETLHFGPARGISNVMEGETAVVEIDDGILLCVHLSS